MQWIGVADQWSGIANVFLDGVFKTLVDTFASPARTKTVLYSATDLSSGNHTLTIEVAGRRSAHSAQNWIWIDAFDITGGESGSTPGGTDTLFANVEQDSSAVHKTGNWYTNINSSHSGGSAMLALDAGAQAAFTFTGSAVRWIGFKDGWAGLAKVFIDGVFQCEVDSYLDATQSKTVLFSIEGLSPGSHTIVIETTGRKNPAAGSAWVWVDAFEFR